MKRQGFTAIEWLVYITLGILLLIFIYYGLIKPILTTGTTIAGELG